MKIIAIAGGSGSGKSTVSYKLLDSNPAYFEIINFDDYQKDSNQTELPTMDGVINWDHPDIIAWQRLIDDLRSLKAGHSISLLTKAHRSHINQYRRYHKRKLRTILPHPVIIVEGYLALYDQRLNKLYDRSYFLELDVVSRNKRRDHLGSVNTSEYIEKVCNPMHVKYVEPTKMNADVIIDVARLSAQEVAYKILQDL